MIRQVKSLCILKQLKKRALPHTGDNASLANLVGVGALLGGALLTKKKKGKPNFSYYNDHKNILLYDYKGIFC
ncbi:LPXTG cell wall anchor domain-containing protein [Streptococcus iniae]|nr:LPXTG cell wall anchor domain-containing protein [Streptococcus iniae]